MLKLLLRRAWKKESLLPDKPAEEQYDFAVSFMKVGDYETAEFALREFIDKNKDHDLAEALNIGMAKLLELTIILWCSSAYLDGYQIIQKQESTWQSSKTWNYDGSTWRKDQGCKMISGLKKEYPKASKSVLQKLSMSKKIQL